MPICVGCYKEIGGRIGNNPPLCERCSAIVQNYCTASSVVEKFNLELAGFEPIKINPESRLNAELQEINNRIEKVRVELLFIQNAVYNIGQDTLRG